MLYAKGKSGDKSTLRMTEELAELIRRTAATLPGGDKGNESTVVRRTVIGIERGRAVVEREIAESLYKSGPVVKNFAFGLPKMDPRDFRRLLALRCMEEMEKPRKPPRELPAAIPSAPPRTLTEARKMECWKLDAENAVELVTGSGRIV